MILHTNRRSRSLLLLLPVLLIYMKGAVAAPDVVPVFTGGYNDVGGYRVYRMETNPDHSCDVFYTPIPPTLDNFPRVAGVTLYQATQSIYFEPGFVSEDGASFVAEIVPNGFAVPQATNLTGTADANMNWIQATNYDETGAVISDGKKFYDNNGREVQSQAKVFYREAPATVYTHVLASQTIKDAYGRDAAQTLPAPIDYADFSYRSNFLQHNAGGAVYSHQNFDLYNNGSTSSDNTLMPNPLWDAASGNPVQGTLAWYYSTSNSWEPYTPVTNYPYMRQTWYQDGTGNAKKIAGLGDPLKMGSGREESGYTIPVANELDFYLQVRNKYFATTDLGALPVSLAGQATQSVSHDANGTETVTIQDHEGATLMTARPGSALTVNNTVTVGPAGSGNTNIYYFKLLAMGTVGITGGSYTLYDMNTETPLSFTSGNSLPARYYKVINTGTTALTLTYSNSYTDISYNFYNQKGQLVANIAPQGVTQLLGTGINNFSTLASLPHTNLFKYDLQGRLLSSSSPDGGLGQGVYRKDGKLRFSQNALQVPSGSYSYTNYDQLGRIIESGQYQPDAGGIAFGSGGMTGILENTGPTGGLTTGTKTDVTMTVYDLPDNSHGLSAYVQDPANIAGAVSTTKRYSTILNNVPSGSNLVSQTWYNYDEEGKMVWMIKDIVSLGAAGYKTWDYTYNVLDQLTKKVFQAGTPSETFVHYYDYDPANTQLWHVYTNTTDNPGTKMLQATYIYYLHGKLKRIEMAGNLQGTDYTYTLNGALKAINNSNKTQDPGNDGVTNGFGVDAFGEVLDYYTNDYTGGKTGAAAITGVDASSIAPDSYVGNVKAMTWYSEKPTGLGLTDAPTTYVFNYDPKYELTGSTWGTGINFATAPAGFTPTTSNQETIKDPVAGTPAYDGNGNILYLQRTNPAGTMTDKFAYTYNTNNNLLQSVTNSAGGSTVTYATYGYDAVGRETSENLGSTPLNKYIQYDAAGKVKLVALDAAFTQPVVQYVYDELGQRIEKISYNNSFLPGQVTYYFGDVIYTQTVTNNTYGPLTPQEYEIAGGVSNRLGIYYKQSNIYAYQLTDHLGNVRAVIAQSGTTYQVRMYSDYYPYGMIIQQGGTNDYRYDYQGGYSEKDGETAWNSFEFRMYNSRIAKWFTPDPAHQSWSPYMAMGNSPANNVDPTGAFIPPTDDIGGYDNYRVWSDEDGNWEFYNGTWYGIKGTDNNFTLGQNLDQAVVYGHKNTEGSSEGGSPPPPPEEEEEEPLFGKTLTFSAVVNHAGGTDALGNRYSMDNVAGKTFGKEGIFNVNANYKVGLKEGKPEFEGIDFKAGAAIVTFNKNLTINLGVNIYNHEFHLQMFSLLDPLSEGGGYAHYNKDGAFVGTEISVHPNKMFYVAGVVVLGYIFVPEITIPATRLLPRLAPLMAQ
jgi:RHS repeat-associated protein